MRIGPPVGRIWRATTRRWLAAAGAAGCSFWFMLRLAAWTKLRLITGGIETKCFAAGIVHCEEGPQRIILLVPDGRSGYRFGKTIHVVQLAHILQAGIGKYAQHEDAPGP